MVYSEYYEQDVLGGAPCLSTPGDFVEPYQFSPQLLPNLEAAIKQFHKLIGNIANIEDYFVVAGAGGTQTMAAALYALSQDKKTSTNKTLNVFAQAPYYPHYLYQVATTPNLQWQSPTTSFSKFTATHDRLSGQVNANFAEIVTYPNNPDGVLRKPLLTESSSLIYDCVYWWPQFNQHARNGQLDKEIMIFSLSKLSGHAGTRFGWALVKKESFADAMNDFFMEQTLGLSVDAQLRAYAIMQKLVSEEEKQQKESVMRDDDPLARKHGRHHNGGMVNFVTAKFEERWRLVNSLFTRYRKKYYGTESYKFELVNNATKGAYLWIKCLDESTKASCQMQFASVGLIGNDGSAYGVDESFVRFTMFMRSVEIRSMLTKLERRLFGNPEKLVDNMKIRRKYKQVGYGC
eukprot:g3615.t1